MRAIQYTNGSYYYISGAGAKGYSLFSSPSDSMRFVLSLIVNQSKVPVYNTHWYFYMLGKKGTLPIGPDKQKAILKHRYIELLGFCLVGNEYHLLIKALSDHVPSVYMHRTLTSYAKYINAKNKTRGHVFEGPYKAERIKSATEVVDKLIEIHALPYITDTKSASETTKEEAHQASSLPDYLDKNRWGEFLETRTLNKHFKNIALHKHALAKYIKDKKSPI